MNLPFIRLGPYHDTRVILAVAGYFTVYGFAGIKLTMVSQTLLLLHGAVGGALLGWYLGDVDESLAHAGLAVVVALVAQYVLFIVDDIVITSKYDVTLPVIHLAPETLPSKLLVYSVYEAFVILVQLPILMILVLGGAWLGALVRTLRRQRTSVS